jgi:hypothetical protein
VVIAFPFLTAGLVATPVLLLVPAGGSRFLLSIAHLSAVVALGFWLAMALAPLARAEWFADRSWAPARRRLAGETALVVVVTGTVALVTLASSAALRLQPSLQFLQLLSALDIAWAAGAVIVGGHLLWSRRTAGFAGLVVGVLCVLSIWNYLRVVGFTADDGWLLDGGELMKLVIPFDMAVAVVAIGVLLAASRRA